MSARFDLSSYEPVEARLARFWTEHPDGRVLTDLIYRDERQYIIRAEAYTDREDVRPAATGYAEEIIGSSPVNKTAALENAETSAIGRCLANLNYAPKGARPSREEMEKAGRVIGNGQPPEPTPADAARARLRAECEPPGLDLDLGQVATAYQRRHGVSLRDETNVDRINAFTMAIVADVDAVLAEPAEVPA